MRFCFVGFVWYNYILLCKMCILYLLYICSICLFISRPCCIFVLLDLFDINKKYIIKFYYIYSSHWPVLLLVSFTMCRSIKCFVFFLSAPRYFIICISTWWQVALHTWKHSLARLYQVCMYVHEYKLKFHDSGCCD